MSIRGTLLQLPLNGYEPVYRTRTGEFVTDMESASPRLQVEMVLAIIKNLLIGSKSRQQKQNKVCMGGRAVKGIGL